jgi:hypothetical protein
MTKLLIIDDHHYLRDKDNLVWISSQNVSSFWDRYLQVFDTIKVVARIENVTKAPEGMVLSSKKNVEFYEIYNYIGPYDFIINFFKIKKQLKNVYSDCTHAIFRLPSELAFITFNSYFKSNKPFATELLVDPWNSLGPKTTKSLVRPFVRLRWFLLTKKMVRLA